MREPRSEDPVSLMIGYCHNSRFAAEHIFHLLAVEHHHHLETTEGSFTLSDADIRDFVTRYSAEIEPEFDLYARHKEERPET